MKSKVLTIVIVFFINISFLNASFCANDFEKVFPTSQTESGSNNLKNGMIDGATLFLQSYAVANLLLSVGEASDKGYFDLNASVLHVNEAISKLEQSKTKYNDAYKLALSSEYIDLRITQLKNFDYSKYATENNLNSEIMSQVSKILTKGDVRGFYKQNIENVDSILSALYSVQNYLNDNQKPPAESYWALIRLYSDALLFGNYATAAAREAFNTL